MNAPSRVSVEHGETIVSLDAATQEKSATRVVALESTVHQSEQRAYAQVLEMRAWSDARNAYLVAKGQGDKARAAAEESRTDVVRQRQLHQAGSASAEAALEADVKARADQATVQPAEAAVGLLESSMRETWGEPLASWLMEGAPQLEELVNERSVLIQRRGRKSRSSAVCFQDCACRSSIPGQHFLLHGPASGARAFPGPGNDSVLAARRAAIGRDRTERRSCLVARSSMGLRASRSTTLRAARNSSGRASS